MKHHSRGLFNEGELVAVSSWVFFSILWSAGSTLLNINNGTDDPCCCSCVPRSQFVLTVGVRGLTGKGNRVNPVPGGIGTWWWAAAHKPSDQMFLVTLWKMSLRLWDRLRQTLLSIITDVRPQLVLNTSLRIWEWNGTGHAGHTWAAGGGVLQCQLRPTVLR